MSPSLPVSHQLYRVSSRPTLSLNTTRRANAYPPPFMPLSPSSFPNSASIAKCPPADYPPYDVPNPSTQGIRAGGDKQPAPIPQLPQLPPSKPTSTKVHQKLRKIKSFISRHLTDSDDDLDRNGGGRWGNGTGADASTQSVPTHHGIIKDSGDFDMCAPAPRSPCAHTKYHPHLSHTESLCIRPKQRTSSIKRFKHVPNLSDSEFRTQALPGLPSPRLEFQADGSARCVDPKISRHPRVLREDTTFPMSMSHWQKPKTSSETISARSYPNSPKVNNTKHYVNSPGVPTLPSSHVKQISQKSVSPEPLGITDSSATMDFLNHHLDLMTVEPSDRCQSSASVLTSQSLSVSSTDDDTTTALGGLRYDKFGDTTLESFEITVAHELRPAAVCKLVLAPGAHPGESSEGSDTSSSGGGSSFEAGCSSSDENIFSLSTRPNHQYPDDEKYIDLKQIKQVIGRLNSLVESFDQSSENPNHSIHANPRITNKELLQIIKHELDH